MCTELVSGSVVRSGDNTTEHAGQIELYIILATLEKTLIARIEYFSSQNDIISSKPGSVFSGNGRFLVRQNKYSSTH